MFFVLRILFFVKPIQTIIRLIHDFITIDTGKERLRDNKYLIVINRRRIRRTNQIRK